MVFDLMSKSHDSIFSLAGKVALVTGAGSGIGRAVAEAIAEAGGNVVCTDIDESRAKATESLLLITEAEHLSVGCDVTDEGSVQAGVDLAMDHFGHLDIVVANAGVSDPDGRLLHEYSSDVWDEVIRTNLKGVFYTNRAALRAMVPRASGKVINVASMWGLVGTAGARPLPGYAASKGAVINLTRELALEYAPYNIQVNAICPGFFRTGLAGGVYDSPQAVEAMSKLVPMGRIAETSEIKGAAVFLSSDASSYVTGQMLIVDGGYLAK